MEFIQLTGLPAMTPEEELVITSELAKVIWLTPPFVYRGIQIQIIRTDRVIHGVNDVCVLVEIKNLQADNSQIPEIERLCDTILKAMEYHLSLIGVIKSFSLALTVMVYCPWGAIVAREGQWVRASFLST